MHQLKALDEITKLVNGANRRVEAAINRRMAEEAEEEEEEVREEGEDTSGLRSDGTQEEKEEGVKEDAATKKTDATVAQD